MRRTKDQAAETGKQILKAAETLFLDHGYDNVSLEEIANLAGVTRGAVHWHFKNKHGLLLALRREAQEPFKRLADDLSVGDAASSLRRLADMISETFEWLESDQRQRGLLLVTMRLDIALAQNNDILEDTFSAEMSAILVRIFSIVDQDTGLLPPWTPEKAASMLSATINGLLMEWALGRGSFSIFPDGSQFIRTMLAGLQNKLL